MRWVLIGVFGYLLLLFVFFLWWRAAHRRRPPFPPTRLYVPQEWVEREHRRNAR